MNAFTNTKLNKLVYCYCPEGFGQNRQILELLIALYRQKLSPLLWYKEHTSILAKFRFKLVLNTNCLFIDKPLIIFFYIDNIAILFAKKDFLKPEEFEAKLLY